jgi:hypothetical protein
LPSAISKSEKEKYNHNELFSSLKQAILSLPGVNDDNSYLFIYTYVNKSPLLHDNLKMANVKQKKTE